jgi:hypothetical protein
MSRDVNDGPDGTDPQLPVTDEELIAAQQNYALGEVTVWELMALEKLHLQAQPEIAPDAPARRGTVAIDSQGDAWKRGTTRWTCTTSVDGQRIRSVGRLPQNELLRQYGPLRQIGTKDSWTYTTIRGRR